MSNCVTLSQNNPLAVAEFVTLREKLLKIGARIVETQAASNSRSPPPVRRLDCFEFLPAPYSRRGRERRAEIVSAPQSNHIQLQRVQSADRPSERTHCGIASGITARIKSAMRGDGVNKTGLKRQ